MTEIILSRNFESTIAHNIGVAVERGAYQALKKALEMSPADIVKEVRKSNLRGRGGAGFPTGMKWGFLGKSPTKYLCVNADEGEPGTFKDRYILERDPHLLVEGIVISCYALDIHQAYVYMRGEFTLGAQRLAQALKEAEERNFVGQNILGSGFDLVVTIHRGGGSYECGEETALIESLEGKKGWPRIRPPFPAIKGLFEQPTVVNNVETLSNIPAIILRGGEWFASLGTEKSGGTKLFPISGHVVRPGVYELPMGTPLRHLIYECAGGIKYGKTLKAVLPGGSSAPVLLPDEIDVGLDFDSLAQIGSMLGSGAVMVLDEDTSIPKVCSVAASFYANESCGQCTPCREGTWWMASLVRKIVERRAGREDFEILKGIPSQMSRRCLCGLGEGAAMAVGAFLNKFSPEFEVLLRFEPDESWREKVRSRLV